AIKTVLGMQGNVGIGTTAPGTKLEIAQGSGTLVNIKANVSNNAIVIASPYTAGADYAPGLVWRATDTSPTKNVAGIFAQLTPAGSYLHFGTSNLYSSGITNDAMVIDGTGNVGIGTTTPGYKLELSGTGATAVNVLSSDNTQRRGYYMGGPSLSGMDMLPNTGEVRIGGFSTADYFPVIYSDGVAAMTFGLGATPSVTIPGNVGIGTTNPSAAKLVVAGDIRTGTSGTNGCVQNFAGTAIAGVCSSDAALKTVTGNVTGVLNKLLNLDLVTYQWNQTAADVYHDSMSVTNTGYIAQQVEQQFPELVTLDSKGYRQLNYTTLSLYGLEAVKELNLNLNSIAGIDSTNGNLGTGATSFATSFFNNLFARITAWMADSANNIGDFVVRIIHSDKVYTKTLCVGDPGSETCLTQAQINSILANVNSASSSSSSGGGSGSGSGSASQQSAISAAGSSATLQSISITTPATKLSFIVSDTLDISGLVVTGTYSDASTKVETITNENISGFDSSAPVTGQTLTVTDNGKTATYTVDIVAATP
ncbi:MAG: tail fiber domain-containing protein, partial [bacterium]